VTGLPAVARSYARGAGAALALALACCLLGGCAQLQPLAAPDPKLAGTYIGTWGGSPTTLVIQGFGTAPPDSGVFVGSVSVGGSSAMQVSGIITHPSPQGPVENTFTARVGYLGGQLILVMNLPTLEAMDNFEQLSLAVEGDALVGKAERNYPQGPKGPIRLVRQPPKP
jgi:hypothetical protein